MGVKVQAWPNVNWQNWQLIICNIRNLHKFAICWSFIDAHGYLGVGVSCNVNPNQTLHQSFSPVQFNASWQVLKPTVRWVVCGLSSICISQSSPQVLIEELIQMFGYPPQQGQLQLYLSIIKSGNWKKVRLKLDTTIVLNTHSSLE